MAILINNLKEKINTIIEEKIRSEEYENIKYSGCEDESFLVKEHAEGLSDYLKNKNYIVTFRNAGKYTIEKIKKGNVCKGHKILNKSIKNKGNGYTYNIDSEVFENYKGCIGVPEENSGTPPKLKGLYRYNKDRNEIDKIGVVKLDEYYYTGDYDMHDLITNDYSINNRVIKEMNKAMIEKEIVGNDIINRENNFKNNINNDDFSKNPFSLIRHGSQTSYISFLLSDKVNASEEIVNVFDKSIEFNIATIDDSGIVAFVKEKIFHLNTIGKIKKFYEDNKISIPFYYFLNHLIKKLNIEENNEELTNAEINNFDVNTTRDNETIMFAKRYIRFLLLKSLNNRN